MYEKWCSVLDAVPAREAALDAELQNQQQNEQLRREFAGKANDLGAFIEEKHTALADLSMQGMGSMEASWKLAFTLVAVIEVTCAIFSPGTACCCEAVPNRGDVPPARDGCS